MAEALSTAASEAIRIADAYLPGASTERRMALAMEIVTAINRCEAELSDEITTRLSAILKYPTA